MMVVMAGIDWIDKIGEFFIQLSIFMAVFIFVASTLFNLIKRI